jgi:hypothetical protein
MKALDLTGQHFGWLTVLSRQGTDKGGNALWLCRCRCENEIVVAATSLRSGNTRSCGCLRASDEFRAKMREASTKGATASVRGGIQLASARREEPNANSATGVRGVIWIAKRQCYVASAQLAGERLTVTGIKSLEEATRVRAELRAKLEDKYRYNAEQPDED